MLWQKMFIAYMSTSLWNTYYILLQHITIITKLHNYKKNYNYKKKLQKLQNYNTLQHILQLSPVITWTQENSIQEWC